MGSQVEVTRYVEEVLRLAGELRTSPEVIASALVLRRLESIASQLYSQGYHRGYEESLDELVPSPNVELRPPDPDRRWQSPATAQRLVD